MGLSHREVFVFSCEDRKVTGTSQECVASGDSDPRAESICLESDRGRLTLGASLCLPDVDQKKAAFLTGCHEDEGHSAGKVGSVRQT